MRFHERRGRQRPRRVQRGEIEPHPSRRVLGQNPFGVVPGARRRSMHLGIGIENTAVIGIERPRPLVRRQQLEEILAQIGIEARQRVEEGALEFGPGAEKGRAQHDAADPLGMRLCVGQRQRRAPGASDDHPALEAELLADRLHVRDQMRQRVVLEAALGTAAAGPALVEQDGVETFGIEQPPVIGLAAAAGAAMQIDRRDAAGPADTFDIDLVTVADRQPLRGQRRERIGACSGRFPRVGVRRHDRRPSPAYRRQNCDRGNGCGRRRIPLPQA